MILTNIILNSAQSYSHEPTKRVNVKIRPTNNGLVVTIRDYGRGFNVKSQAPGLGLTITGNFVMNDFRGSINHKRPAGRFRKGTVCTITLNNY